MATGVAAAPRAIGCLVKAATSGGVPTVLSTGLKVAGGIAATETATAIADKVDPSGNARKVVEIATVTVIGRTKCFAAGTPVAMCDGSLKAIERVEPGEQVVARDPDTLETACREVLRTSERDASDLIDLEFASTSGKTETLRVTPEHLFALESGEWTEAGNLGGDDVVATTSGAGLRLAGGAAVLPSAPVYNLVVDQFHTYFVGESGAWVHNSYPTKPAASAGKGSASAARAAPIKSRIAESPKLVREAEAAGRSTQRSLDHLTSELAKGNLNPGTGTRPIGGGLSEARARDGARVYFRQTDDGTIEILALRRKWGRCIRQG